jgi:hypothetical protein
MTNRKAPKPASKDATLNTNEVMHDYEFYLKMYTGDHKMDFESPETDI